MIHSGAVDRAGMRFLQLEPFMRAAHVDHSAEASTPFPSAIAITLIQKYIELLCPAYDLNIELQAESKVTLARVPALIVELLAAWDHCLLDVSDVAALRVELRRCLWDRFGFMFTSIDM